MTNNHSRASEKPTQSVLNLLELHSLYAYWDNNENNWRVRDRSDDRYTKTISVRYETDIEGWIAAVRALESS